MLLASFLFIPAAFISLMLPDPVDEAGPVNQVAD